MRTKPIRIFWSPLSRRLYASRAYKESGPGIVTITGEQFDVTNEIAALIEKHGITFDRAEKGGGGVKTKARDLIQGWPWPHSTSRPYPTYPTPLIEIFIAHPPEIPAEVWTYLDLMKAASSDLAGAGSLRMWGGESRGSRTAQGIEQHDAHVVFKLGRRPK